MKGNHSELNYRDSKYPRNVSIIALIGFLIVYYCLNRYFVNSHYLTGLLFIIPFIVLHIIFRLTLHNRIKPRTASMVTFTLLFVFGLLSLIGFVIALLDELTTITTNPNKYERVLRVNNYQEDDLAYFFPSSIPDDAKNVVFRYNPQILQGGEVLALRYQTDSVTINEYVEQFSQKAKRVGSYEVMLHENIGIYNGVFSFVNYESLSNEYTIYLLYSKPYMENDWNHGRYSLVAINETINEIIFIMERW